MKNNNINKITCLLFLSVSLSLAASESQENLFFGIQAAYSMMSVNKNDTINATTLSQKISERGYSFNAEIGYNYTPDIFVTTEFNYQYYNDVNVYNSLLSFNKRFIYKSIQPYLGLIGGLSTIQLTKSHTESPLNDTTGNQIAVGLQAGIEYMIDTNLCLLAEYQILKAEHATNIYSNPSEIELLRDYHSMFSVGLRW